MAYYYILLFALINIVGASVVINVYEDDEDMAPHSLRDSCNYQACDQLCRRLGFPGGACVGDKCQCDNFELLNIKSSALEYLLKSRPMKPMIESCDDLVCDQTCKQDGYEGGICSGGDCYCWKQNSVFRRLVSMTKMENSNDIINENQNVEILSKGNAIDYMLKSRSTKPAAESCNDVECNQSCKKYGYEGGVCSGGDCYCWKHNSENQGLVSIKKIGKEDEINKDISENKKQVGSSSKVIKQHPQPLLVEDSVQWNGECNNVNCYFTCARMHYMGGSCIGRSCVCF